MTSASRILLSVLACTAALALAGCGSSPPKPTQLSGTIKASPAVNPSASARPSPLLLRVYELKTDAAFGKADFMALYQRDQAELAADLVAREEYMLSPGETRSFTKKLAPETRFIGVLAAYRDLEHAVWRKVVPVPPGEKLQAVIQADALSVDVTVKK
ncbi:type VI secretion system lipoprotein TssJ [Paucibacter sp. R3-3]|uniref:Type VI secretion system lipoprotein TssJ n=1 Tax=Roseateles agri TaxID=3098619 RepID=A0ABU5DAJ2_9BURK|nr:type VI secretion system lipoprotein TssJ [Paucibacter sp. R3-3]MDY0743302.1 type VI secretion system lipoprotein TssJ [Paucibacter sp. R3-3]